MRRAHVAVLAGIGLIVGACSLPVDERVSPYDADDLPPALTGTTTTSSTTTTTSTTTTLPEPGASIPSSTTTTTIELRDTDTVTVFYTIGASDELQPLRVARIAPVPVTSLIELLEAPSGISDFGLRTAVRVGLIDEVVLDRAIATVSLDPIVLDRLSNSEQQQAIAQIVLTLTSFVTADAGSIGFVRFEVDGDGFSVFVPSFGGSSEPGEPLAFSDFAVLIAARSTPTTVTTPPDATSPPATAG